MPLKQGERKTLSDLSTDHTAAVVQEALKRARGSVSGAAKILGVSRVTIWRWTRKNRAASAREPAAE
jgi:transcriptional regulator with PAS, ATPase and Fis domain